MGPTSSAGVPRGGGGGAIAALTLGHTLKLARHACGGAGVTAGTGNEGGAPMEQHSPLLRAGPAAPRSAHGPPRARGVDRPGTPRRAGPRGGSRAPRAAHPRAPALARRASRAVPVSRCSRCHLGVDDSQAVLLHKHPSPVATTHGHLALATATPRSPSDGNRQRSTHSRSKAPHYTPRPSSPSVRSAHSPCPSGADPQKRSSATTRS
ncbi:unnamed protein product [Gadus morhua 'NCC']